MNTSIESANGLQFSKRSYFSTVHLWAAYDCAKHAATIEENAGPRSTYSIEHRARVVSGVIEAATFLEAAINEILADCNDSHQGDVALLSEPVRVKISEVWKKRESFGTLERYAEVLGACAAPLFDKGRQPYQDAKLVIKLRHALLHYVPEDLVAGEPHSLGDLLKSKFPNNRLMHGSGNPYFPDHCLGHGCAQWAADSSREFADEFFLRIGVTPNYQSVGQRYGIPIAS